MRLEITENDLRIARTVANKFNGQHRGNVNLDDLYSGACYQLALTAGCDLPEKFANRDAREALIRFVAKRGVCTSLRYLLRKKHTAVRDAAPFEERYEDMPRNEEEQFDPMLTAAIMEIPEEDRKNMLFHFSSGIDDSKAFTSFKTRMKSTYRARKHLTELQQKLALEETYEFRQSTRNYNRREKCNI